MTTTDTSEAGLERLMVQALTGRPPRPAGHGVENEPAAYGGAGYIEGHPHDYDREVALDLHQLWGFWLATQASELAKLKIEASALTSTAARQLLHRLQGEITRHGVIHVLRKGIKHGPASLQLYFGTPTPGNDKAAAAFAANIFSVTRQVRYSRDETQRSLDLVLFINGLPLAIPWLKWLRDHAGDRLHFWPFDGWTPAPGKSVIVEVYPSVFRNRYPRDGRTLDQQDAYATAKWMASMDARGALAGYFAPPLTVAERAMADLEGWIFGVR